MYLAALGILAIVNGLLLHAWPLELLGAGVIALGLLAPITWLGATNGRRGKQYWLYMSVAYLVLGFLSLAKFFFGGREYWIVAGCVCLAVGALHVIRYRNAPELEVTALDIK
jgi:hypothetical protein